jgi:hypothetical protein
MGDTKIDNTEDQSQAQAQEQPEVQKQEQKREGSELTKTPEQDSKVPGTITDEKTDPKKKGMSNIDNSNSTNIDSPDEPKEDFFMLRVKTPNADTDLLMEVYGKDGFAEFKDMDDYWEDPEIQKQFKEAFGDHARYEFENFYQQKLKEYSAFKMNKFKHSVSVYDLYRDNTDYLESGVKMSFNDAGMTYRVGDIRTNPMLDIKEASEKFITIAKEQEDGTIKLEQIEYSPDALKELEQDPNFTGLAYPSDMGESGYDPVNGLSLFASYNGQVYDPHTKKMVDVRNDQIVSRWDIDTDSLWDGILDNNKIESDGIWDYARIAVKAPINMAVSMLDTAIQLGRAATSAGYGISNLFREDGDKLSVREDEFYRWLTARGIQTKGYSTSLSREAMVDGYFFSLESFLQTTADIALQVALARGLGAAGSGLRSVVGVGSLSPAEAMAAKQVWARFTGKATLTALAIKDSYNEALEVGFSEYEAATITGAMAFAMWKAQRFSDYIFENYEMRASRRKIKEGMSKELRSMWRRSLNKTGKKTQKAAAKIKKSTKAVVDEANKKLERDTFARRAMYTAEKTIKRVFSSLNAVKGKGIDSAWWYAAQEEALEEMTEELYQDGVKHVFSAYGKLINDAKGVGKGRYSTIFDEGYFKNAIERYLTSGIAGGMGGPMGMAMSGGFRGTSITSNSSVAEIVAAGKADVLIDVLKGMKENGELGPTDLSIDFNDELKVFEPIVQGREQTSLGDMVFKQFQQDINIINTWLHSGKFGDALTKFNEDPEFKDKIENITMRKDFILMAGRNLDIHQRTGISLKAYQDLDNMTEQEFAETLSTRAAKTSAEIEKLKENRDKARESVKEKSGDTKQDTGKDKESKNKEGKNKEGKNKKTEGDKDTEGKEKKKVETRMNKEAEVNGVNDPELISELMDNYRRMRAMANGTAAEYYFIQSILSEDPIFGLKKNREKGFEYLGNNPFVDHMMETRKRSLLIEKEHAKKIIKSEEIEKSIDSIKEGPDMINDITDTLSKYANILNKGSVSKLLALLDNLDYSTISDLFNIDSPNSIFMPDSVEGMTPEELMIAKNKIAKGIFFEIAKKDPINTLFFKAVDGEYSDPMVVNLAQEFINTGDEKILKYFKEVSKNPADAKVPILNITVDDDAFIYDVDILPGSKPLIENLNGTSVNAKGVIPIDIIRARRSKAILENIKEKKSYFDKSNFKPYNPKTLFNKTGVTTRGVAISGISVSEAITSEINDTLESVYAEDIFTKTDTSVTDELLKQIELKRALSSVFEGFLYGHTAPHMQSMLTQFRKNVINILEGEYDPNDITKDSDSFDEAHSYKDYSMFSDMFTDYIYDPIKIDDLFHQDPDLDTEEEAKLRNELMDAQALFRIQAVDNDGNKINVPIYDIPEALEMLKSRLDIKYNNLATPNDIDAALNALNNDVLRVDENHSVLLDGMTRLNLMEWLLRGTRTHLENAAGTATPTAFIQEKQKSIKKQFDVFNNMIEYLSTGDLVEFRDIVEEEVPEYYDFISTGMVLKTKEDYIKLAKINIKLEALLYRILQEDIDIEKYFLNVTTDDVAKSIVDYIMTRVGKQEDVVILVGAMFVNFTPFYSKFKTILEGKTEKDKMVIAAQENAAKYAAAAVYSPEFINVMDTIIKKRVTGPVIKGILIQGVAGSGKTTAVTELGMKIGSEILEGEGKGSAILPVSNTKGQIKRLSNVVGDLAKDNDGMAVQDLHELLRKAVTEDNEAAKEKLKGLGAILIDEVTYIPFSPTTVMENGRDIYEPYKVLNSIDDLIKEYNKKNRSGDDALTLIMMGDTNQSGASATINNRVVDLSITSRRAISLEYMDFSFRGRNSFLVDSVKAISKASTMEEYIGRNLEDLGTREGVVIPPGMKYGITNNTFYGVNIVDSVDNTTNEFVKALNDSEFVNNVRKKLTTDPEFNIIIAPESLDTFINNESMLLNLYNEKDSEGEYKYRDRITLLAVDEVGGDEANYIIAELPFMDAYNTTTAKILKDKLNTVATRAFDFAYIINKAPKLKIDGDAKPKRIDGQTITPNNEVEDKVKKSIKDMQLAILSDIAGDSGTGGTTKVGIAKDGSDETETFELPESPAERILTIIRQNNSDAPRDIVTPIKSTNFGTGTNRIEAISAYSNVLRNVRSLFVGPIDADTVKDTVKIISQELSNLEKYVVDKDSVKEIVESVNKLLELATVEDNDFRNYMSILLQTQLVKFEADNTTVKNLLKTGRTIKLSNVQLTTIDKSKVEDVLKDFIASIKKTGSTRALEAYLNGNESALKVYTDGMDSNLAAVFNEILNGTFIHPALDPDEINLLFDYLYNSIKLYAITKDKKLVDKLIQNAKKKDLSAGNAQVSELRFRLYEGSSKVLSTLIQDIESGNSQLKLPPNSKKLIDTLFENYSKESVLKYLKESAASVLQHKGEVTKISKDIKELSSLATQVGLTYDNTDHVALREEVLLKYTEGILKVERGDYSGYRDIFITTRLLEMISKVHAAKIGEDSALGTLYYYYNRITKDIKYTLRDYIDNFDRKFPDRTYTLKPSAKNIFYMKKNIPSEYSFLETEKARNDYLMIGKDIDPKVDNISDATKIEILAVRDYKGKMLNNGVPKMDMFVVAVNETLGTKTIVAKLNTETANNEYAEDYIMPFIERFAAIMKVNKTAPKGVEKITLVGKPSDLLNLRAGEVKKGPHIPINEVIEGNGINISSEIFVVTDKDSSFAGKMYRIYTYNNLVDLDTELIKNEFRDTGKLPANAFVNSVVGGLPTNIGVLPVDLDIPLRAAVEKYDPDIKFSNTVSVLSLTMQKYFAEKILSYPIGDLMIDGTVVEQKHHDAANLLLNEFNSYMSSKSAANFASIDSKINSALNYIKSDNLLTATMEGLATVQMEAMTDPTLSDIDRNASSLLTAKTAKEYTMSEDGTHIVQEVEDGTYTRALNINYLVKRLSSNPKSRFIDSLDSLMQATGFKIKPKLIGNGTRDGIMGVLSRKFTDAFSDNTYASIETIYTPGIELTESVKYQILDIETSNDSGIVAPSTRADLDKLARMEEMHEKFSDDESIHHELYNKSLLTTMLNDINSFTSEFSVYLNMSENAAQKDMIKNLKEAIEHNIAKIEKFVLNHTDIVSHESIRNAFNSGSLVSDKSIFDGEGMSDENIADFYKEEETFIDRIVTVGKVLDPAVVQHILNSYFSSDFDTREGILLYPDDLVDRVFEDTTDVSDEYRSIIEDVIKNCY